MSTPRFAPRDFAKLPSDFGARGRLVWIQPGDGKPDWMGDQYWIDNQKWLESWDGLAASQLQHSYAVVIRHKIKTQYKTLGKYCTAADIPTDRFGKMIGGKLLMRFEDTVRAERLLGGVHADALTLMEKVVAAHNR